MVGSGMMVTAVVGFAHGIPAGRPPVRQKAGFAHGDPAGRLHVRQKAGFAHGAPAGRLHVCRKAGFTHGTSAGNTSHLRGFSLPSVTGSKSPLNAPVTHSIIRDGIVIAHICARQPRRRTFRASAQEYRTGVEIDFPMPTFTAFPLVLAPHLVPSCLKIDFCVNVRSMKHPGNRPDITYSKVSTFLIQTYFQALLSKE